ncbi:MAG: hypothetical protein KC486_23420, partial [Myxococcales bacterium]|nr:hypothetical protein [Myxococcales bacterium]
MRPGSVGLALCVAALGCVLANPAFDDTEGASGVTTTAASSTATGAVTAASGSGEATLGSTGTTGAGTTGEMTTAITAATADATTTGGPTDCWASQSPWSVEEFAPAGLGENPRSFRYDADGLGVTYSAGAQGARMPHRATRAARDEPFTGAEQIAFWDGLGAAVDEAVRVGEGELFIANGVDKINGADLMVSRWDGASWPLPQPLGPAVNVDTANDR